MNASIYRSCSFNIFAMWRKLLFIIQIFMFTRRLKLYFVTCRYNFMPVAACWPRRIKTAASLLRLFAVDRVFVRRS